jgi:hypothetical protein
MPILNEKTAAFASKLRQAAVPSQLSTSPEFCAGVLPLSQQLSDACSEQWGSRQFSRINGKVPVVIAHPDGVSSVQLPVVLMSPPH